MYLLTPNAVLLNIHFKCWKVTATYIKTFLISENSSLNLKSLLNHMVTWVILTWYQCHHALKNQSFYGSVANLQENVSSNNLLCLKMNCMLSQVNGFPNFVIIRFLLTNSNIGSSLLHNHPINIQFSEQNMQRCGAYDNGKI